MVYIKPTVHNQTVQIRLRYTRLFETQLRSYLRVYKEDLNPHSLLQSQKSGLVSRRIMAGQLTQKISSMTLLTAYSPAFLVRLVSLIALVAPGNQIYLHLCLLCHCWSRTSLKRGGCTNTTNTMYKTHKIPHLKSVATRNYLAIRRVNRRVV